MGESGDGTSGRSLREIEKSHSMKNDQINDTYFAKTQEQDFKRAPSNQIIPQTYKL